MLISGIFERPTKVGGKRLIKTRGNNFLLRLALFAALGMMPATGLAAQAIATLHSFTALDNNTNHDGADPIDGLVLSGNTLYGTALHGGHSGNGTVFAVNTDGSGFANLYSFTALASFTNNGVANPTNSDGANPRAGLLLSGNTLFGTTLNGGTNGFGTVFRVNTDGTGFTNLHSFSGGSDGGYPVDKLILSGNTLYGTAEYGGNASNGTVFALSTDGAGFTNLYSFTALANKTNSDGATPLAGLVLSGTTLYGTTIHGGSSGGGTVFALSTNGTGFTNLYSFTGGNDGSNSVGGLLLSDGTLYGTVEYGGTNGSGAVFKINTNGTGFKNLYSFTALNNFTNSDGANPYAGLILSGSRLYGTTLDGGTGSGTIFAVNTDGSGFTNLYSFTALLHIPNSTNSDGANSASRLVLAGNTLYGTAEYGGSSGDGTVFSLSLGPVSQPQLAIARSGAKNVILTWSTNAAGFMLQSTTNLNSPTLWTTVSPGPVIVNGLNTVTNPLAGAPMFYRLSQ